MSSSSLAPFYPFANGSFTANVSVVSQLSAVVVPSTKPIRASGLCVLITLIPPETSVVPRKSLLFDSTRPWNGTLTSIQYPQWGPTTGPGPPTWVCQINVESVKLLYWPIENSTTSSPNRSLASTSLSQYTTVINGFTLYVCPVCRQQQADGTIRTSPSVYVAYINIGATSGRPTYDIVTGSLCNATRGYDPASLSTDPCGYGYGNWKPMNYTNLQYPVAASVIKNGCSIPPVALMDGNLALYHGFAPWGTGNPAATPLFSVPGDITLVNPSWKTCDVMSYGVWDPPIKLSKKTAMVPAAPTVSQQLTAYPRSPISTPYGPTTIVSSIGDPGADAPRELPTIGNPDSTSPTLHSSFHTSDPPDDARSSEDHSNDDSAPGAPSATIPSTQIDPSAQRIKGSASSLIAAPVANVQSPAPGPSPGRKPSVQPGTEATRFALSLMAPVVTSHSHTVGGQFLAGNPNFMSSSAPIVISDQSGVDIAGTPIELDILSQLAIGDSTLALPESTLPQVHTIADPTLSAEPLGFAIAVGGGNISPGGALKTISATAAVLGGGALQIGITAIPLFAATNKIFIVAEQVFTAKSDAIFTEVERAARPGWGTTIDGTQVSLGSSGLVVIWSSTISLSADQGVPPVFTIGSEVFTPNPTAIQMDGAAVTAGGPGVTVAGAQVSLGSSELLIVGTSTISLSADQPLPTVFTVGSEGFTPNPTAISMDGITITAGGPGITIAGTPVDLQTSGTLVIGNSTFAVIPTDLSTSATSLIFEGQALRRRGNTFSCGVYVITICIVLAAL